MTVIRSAGESATTSVLICSNYTMNHKQDGLAVASIARDDSSPLPGMHHDHNAPALHAGALWAATTRPQCVVNLDRNLKPKLAIMRQCSSVTDRRTDRWTL